MKNDNERYRQQNQEAEMNIKRLEKELGQKNVELENLSDNEVVLKSQMDLLGEVENF